MSVDARCNQGYSIGAYSITVVGRSANLEVFGNAAVTKVRPRKKRNRSRYFVGMTERVCDSLK